MLHNSRITVNTRWGKTVAPMRKHALERLTRARRTRGYTVCSAAIDETAVNTKVQSNIDSTTTTLSLPVMQTQYNAASQAPERPNLITSTVSIFNSYWSLLQPQQRFADGDTAAAGFKNLLFNGAVVIEDRYCPSSHMVFHNTKYIRLYSHKDRKFPGEYVDFRKFFDQDAEIATIQWAGAMVCSSPRLQAALTAITA